MNSKSVQTIARNLRETDKAKSTVSEDVETTKESTTPSVHALDEETRLASSNKVETLEEENGEEPCRRKQFKTQFKPKTWN